MKSLLNKLFAGEFVIDEKPVAVMDRTEPASRAEADKDDAAARESEDLLNSITTLLKDREQLSDLARELKSREGAGESLEPFLLKMLPFLDSFDRILYLARNHSVPDEIANWLKSVESVYYRITQLLESYGLIGIKSIGHTVNLDIHEVVEMVDAPDRPSGTIIAERRKGYVFRGKPLRCASVVVAK